MAGAVAHALIRTIRGHFDNSPSSSSSPSDDSSIIPRVLPGGLILESHQDAGILTPPPRRRSSFEPTAPDPATTNTAQQQRQQQQQQQRQPRRDPVDANPLSVATAVIGLIAASHHTYHDIQDINFAPRTLTASLQTLLRATKSLKLTAQLAYKWLRRVETTQALPYPDRAALIEVDAVIIILAEAAEAVSDAGSVLVEVVREATGAAARISDVVPEHAPAILNVSDRIERVEHLLSKMLIILQMHVKKPLPCMASPSFGDLSDLHVCRSSVPEAMSARATIDISLAVIMGDNAPLAESIRSMPDVFHARGLVAPERLAAVHARPPPSYSIPAPSVPEALPDYSAATPSDMHPDGSVTIRPLGWSVFASLTLADVCILSLVPLPFCSAELRYGEFYTDAFSRRVDPQLAELMERPAKAKAARLASILGSRSEAVAMTDNENFARRVGMEVENQMTRDGLPRLRAQPNLIIGEP